MRILHLLDHSAPRRSAYALRTLSILRQQRKLGWQTIQLTGPRHGAAAAGRDPDGWHFFRTEPAARPWNGLPLLQPLATLQQMSSRLHRVVQLTRPDLLHAHSPALNALAALRVGRRHGLPVLFEVHAAWNERRRGLRYRLARGAETFAARQADAVATISEGLRADLLARGVRGKSVTVVPDGVSIHHHAAPPRDAGLARRLGLGEGPVLGFVGSLHACEGIGLLLEAMPALLPAWPGLRLLVVGGGPDETRLRAQSRQLGLEGRVIFTGAVARQERSTWRALTDVLVYPRLPVPLAHLVPAQRPLEAMAQGCLVAASNVGAHRELIDHGRTGLLFEAGSAGALADALSLLLADRTHWTRLRAAARWQIEYQRTWETSVARYAPVYEKLIERRRAR